MVSGVLNHFFLWDGGGGDLRKKGPRCFKLFTNNGLARRGRLGLRKA